MKWFDGVATVEQLRAKYRELARKYHPDCGGDENIMKQINNEYGALSAALSGFSDTGEETYTREGNERFRAILDEIIGFDMTIEVIGSWIWCFDCFPYKDRLKELGFSWCRKKKAWIWHDKPYRKFHKGEVPLNSIRMKYGSEVIRNRSRQRKLAY